MELDFDKLFSLPMKCLKFNGGYPFYKRNLKWFVKCFGMEGLFTYIFLGLIYQSIHYDLKEGDMLAVCGNGTLMVMYLVISFMLCILLAYKSTFCELINLVKADYEYTKTKLSPEDLTLLQEYALMGQTVSNWWGRLVFIGALAFPGQAIALTIYYSVTEEFRIVNMFPLRYPERMEEFLGPIGQSVLSNFSIFFFEFCSYTGYVGTVPLGPIFMLHACGKIALVERRVKLLFSETDDTPLDIKRKLIEIVKQIQDIYSFVEKIQTAFKVLYEMTLKGSSLILPLMMFMILELLKQAKLPVEFLTITVGAIVLSSIPCYYSDMLLEKVRFVITVFQFTVFLFLGEGLSLAIYSSGWEKMWNKGTRSTLLIILVRATRPVVLKTMFRNICLDALTDVFRDAYSLFNLLYATV